MIVRRTVTRRALLAGSAAAVAAAHIRRARAFAGNPFALGVSSGSPRPDSVILWTRLAPEPLSPDPDRPGGMPPEPVAVRWEVALDDRLTQIVRNGEAAARPEFAHAVHVECAGLEPGRDYWYRFIAGGEASPIGRIRTTPARGAAAAPAAPGDRYSTATSQIGARRIAALYPLIEGVAGAGWHGRQCDRNCRALSSHVRASANLRHAPREAVRASRQAVRRFSLS